MAVARHFMLKQGAEHGMTTPRSRPPTAGRPRHDGAQAGDVGCSPTWAQPSTDGRTVWVACNKANDIVEIDVASWTLRRRIPAGEGIYNLAASAGRPPARGDEQEGQVGLGDRRRERQGARAHRRPRGGCRAGS